MAAGTFPQQAILFYVAAEIEATPHLLAQDGQRRIQLAPTK
jgi:hypothetical protein